LGRGHTGPRKKIRALRNGTNAGGLQKAEAYKRESQNLIIKIKNTHRFDEKKDDLGEAGCHEGYGGLPILKVTRGGGMYDREKKSHSSQRLPENGGTEFPGKITIKGTLGFDRRGREKKTTAKTSIAQKTKASKLSEGEGGERRRTLKDVNEGQGRNRQENKIRGGVWGVRANKSWMASHRHTQKKNKKGLNQLPPVQAK